MSVSNDRRMAKINADARARAERNCPFKVGMECIYTAPLLEGVTLRVILVSVDAYRREATVRRIGRDHVSRPIPFSQLKLEQ